MIRTLSVVLVIGWTASLLWAADKDAAKDSAAVEAAVQKGLKEYKDGKVQDAITSLQEAIQLIQKSTSKGLGSYFPKPPAGWEAGEIESNSIAGGGKDGLTLTQVTRTYRKGDDLSVTITLCTSPQMVEGQKAMLDAFKNPAMQASLLGEGIKLFDKDGWSGWTKAPKDSDAALTAFCKGCLLTITVNKADEKILQQFIGLMDFKAMAEGATSSSKPAK